MDLSTFKKMDKEQLVQYIDFLLFNYRVADAFWFIKVSEAFDLETAEKLNEQVWDRVGGFAAKGLREKFDFSPGGLKGFVKALKLFPWAILVGFNIEEKEEEIIITVPECPAQTARLKRGLGEYVCKHMHKKEFESFARVMDERIQVECIFAPPDPHPKDLFCKWRFTLAR